MKRYRVIDLQGADLMSYAQDEPMTATEIRSTRWQDYKDNFGDPDDRTPWHKFTLDFIADFWELEFEEVAA